MQWKVFGVWGWNKSSSGIELTMSHQLDENEPTGSPGVKATKPLLVRMIGTGIRFSFFNLVSFRQYGKGDV